MKTLSELIREKRLERHWSRQDLADKLGIHHTVVYRYEAGQVVPTVKRLHDIADLLGIPFDNLSYCAHKAPRRQLYERIAELESEVSLLKERVAALNQEIGKVRKSA